MKHDATRDEDAIVDYLFSLGDTLSPVIVDVGGNKEAQIASPFAYKGWRCLIIEPQTYCVALLQTKFAELPNVTIIHSACSTESGEMKLYLGRDGLGSEVSTLSQSQDPWYDHVRSEQFEMVTVRRLNDILIEEALPQSIGILKIDTEGWDYFVLKGLDFTHFNPQVIITEEYMWAHEHTIAKHLLLDEAGYVNVGFSGYNTVWLSREIGASAALLRLQKWLSTIGRFPKSMGNPELLEQKPVWDYKIEEKTEAGRHAVVPHGPVARTNNTIIIHCGSSKNGSTAIQNALLHDVGQLSARGIGVLRVTVPKGLSFADSVVIEEYDIIHTPTVFSDPTVHEHTALMANVYEVYKLYRERKDSKKLQDLMDKIVSVVTAAFQDYHTIIASAEALETSLCLKDAGFKRLLLQLSSMAIVKVVYYQPDSALHAIRSWQQWGWVGKHRYTTWLESYLEKKTARQFFSQRGQSYWGNLIDVQSWYKYWYNESLVEFMMVADTKDTRSHFYQKVLGLPRSIDGPALSSQERNAGWPNGRLRSFPLFFDFMSGDYEKYDAIRQLMIDKSHKRHGETTTFYNQVCHITQKLLLSIDRPETLGESERDALLAQIDQMFAEISSEEVSRVYIDLAETVYCAHMEMRSKATPTDTHGEEIPTLNGAKP